MPRWLTAPASRISIRSATAADRAGAEAVESAAFGAHADVVLPLIEELRRTGAAVEEIIAEVEGEVVGHVMLSRGWVDSAAGPVAVRVLSPLAVLPRHQRQGTGRALVEAAVGSSEEASVPAVFLEGDPGYYARFGFRPAADEGFRAPSARIPEPAFQVLLLAAHEPWMRGPLVHPDAFWTVNAIGPS